MKKYFTASPILLLTFWSNIASMVQLWSTGKPVDTTQMAPQKQQLIKSEAHTVNYKQVDFPQSTQSSENLRVYSANSSVFAVVSPFTGTFTGVTTPNNYQIVDEPQIIQFVSQEQLNKISSFYFKDNKKG